LATHNNDPVEKDEKISLILRRQERTIDKVNTQIANAAPANTETSQQIQKH